MKELVTIGINQGYLNRSFVNKVLTEDVGLMPDQIEDLIVVLEDLGIEIKYDNGFRD